MKKKFSRFLALALVLVFAVSGCASGTGKSSGDNAGGSGSPTMDRIQASGKIRIGIDVSGPPMGFRDDSGNMQGYDVDWANKLAEVLGVEAEFTEVNGETRIPYLTSDRVDVIFCNITGNLERAKSTDFSIPYLRAGIKMLTAAGSPLHTLEDLNDPSVTVCVSHGTTGEELVLTHAPKANLVYVSTFAEQLLQLEQGKCDATFEDSSLIDYAAGSSNGKLEAQPEMYTSDPICIGTQKGDAEWTRYLDMFVSWMISSGYQAEEYEKWWGVPFDGHLTTLW